MVKFTAIIKKFKQQGEKTGWTYIDIPTSMAEQIKPGMKKAFRVKGKIDRYKIAGVSLVPMGGGDYIMALNAEMRKLIKKPVGASVSVDLIEDKEGKKISEGLIECLQDEPEAMAHFKSLAPSHQLYFSNWIESAKTDSTKAKRIAHSVTALSKGQDFGTMLRSMKNKSDELHS